MPLATVKQSPKLIEVRKRAELVLVATKYQGEQVLDQAEKVGFGGVSRATGNVAFVEPVELRENRLAYPALRAYGRAIWGRLGRGVA